MQSFSFYKPEQWKFMPLYEKIGYYKTVLDERFAPYVDKLEVKQLVAKMCPPVKTAEVIRVLSSPDDITEDDFQAGRLLKATHGCGWNIRLSDPTHTVESIRRALHSWNKPYSGDEKQYTYLTPRFFIESIVDDIHSGTSGQAYVYMIRCIHGTAVTVSIRKGHGSSLQNTYTPYFEPLEPEEFEYQRAAKWNDMIRYAERLSSRFEFVRVDFYLASDGVYFSELTFTPASGQRVFSMALEKELGRRWI